ncbi:hypothetical protein J4417_03275, partial [Candidatus Woesearchaeota archaeon]|nr:hypothetical protein [Candidatus Woesearchaeota archaeon]
KPITGARADTSVPTPITPAQPAAETPRTGTSVAPATAPTTAPRAGAPATTASAQPAAEAPRAITITSTAPTTSTVPRATTPAPSQPTTAPRAGTSTTPITQIQPITGARAGTSTAIPAPSTVAAPRAGATPTQSATDRISTPLASTPASRTAASTGTIPVSASTRTTTTPSRTTPTIPAALSQCSDSIDNDGDGFVDYDQELVGCDSLEDNDETNPVAEDVTVEDTTQSIPEEPSGGGGETTAAPSAPAFLETVPIPEAPFEELPPEDLSAEETKPEVQQATAESTMIGRAEKTIERLTKGETIVIDTSQVIAEIKSVEITARKEVHGTAFSIKKTEKSAIPPPAAKNIISTFHIEGPESDKVIEVKVEKEKYTDKTTANCFDIKHNKWRPGKVQEKKSDEKYVYLKVALPCRN